MVRVTVDLTKYKNTFGDHVSPGRYRVVVDEVALDKSKAGNQMINVWFRIVGGDFDGATIADRLTITDKALFRVVGFLQAIGVETPRKRLTLDIDAWKGRALNLDVRDGEPYNGNVRSEVAGYVALAKESMEQTPTGDGLDEFLTQRDSIADDLWTVPAETPADDVQGSGDSEDIADPPSADSEPEIDLDDLNL
jgi:hypothetical protein